MALFLPLLCSLLAMASALEFCDSAAHQYCSDGTPCTPDLLDCSLGPRLCQCSKKSTNVDMPSRAMPPSRTRSHGMCTCSIPTATCPWGLPACLQPPAVINVRPTCPKNFKVAFLGDSGVTSFQKVANMLNAEGIDLLVHAGDMGYGEGKPNAWNQLLSSKLPGVPVLASLGNHDVSDWTLEESYSAILQNMNGLQTRCMGQTGVKMVCALDGMTIVAVAPRVKGSGHATFVQESFTKFPSVFRVCVFHKNQRLMQTGDKGDEAGWEVYEACRRHGALIITGHSHIYSRTHTMASFKDQRIQSRDNHVVLKPGQSVAFVTGTGGMSLAKVNPDLKSRPWWAAVENVHGALICSFNHHGGRLGQCAFKTAESQVKDSFSLESQCPVAACGC